jgi:threonine/homoserine/homoserine lactone efflux protein
MSSALAFAVVKYVGAGYLVYLGVRTLLGARGSVEIGAPQPRSLRRVFGDAIAVQVFNPKAALFFFAFLPQFVDPQRGSALVQVIFLGGVDHGMALITDSAYALAAGHFGGWVRRSARVVRIQRGVTGATYIGLGLFAATAGRSK